MKFSLSLFVLSLTGSTLAQELSDIPTTAVGAGQFETLVAALGAAGLVEALSEPNGPFTVFAPTDAAFSGLPTELVACLLEPDNADALTSILTYHVVPGAVFSTDLVDGATPTTLSNETLSVDLTDGVKINDSTVVTADIEASNGVIHVIDSVLVPPSLDVAAFLGSCGISSIPTDANATAGEPVDIPTTAVNAGVFETLVAALDAADLVTALAEPNGPFTVFAPNDEAFDALPSGLVACLLEPENSEALTSILTYHVVEGAVLSTDLESGMTPETLNGETLTIDLSDGVTINENTAVISADVVASNGVIHVIDSVLVPPSIDVEAFLAGCDVEPAPVVEDSGASVSSTILSAAAFIMAFVAM